ncbi:Gfo/Idh/MocA family protein [Knoellia subterranea]|uniref:Oxidoreductase n=1 Tax=Knoellia subterranea KCTC 19937 TaxID=1385521 RepID=A0A0A0JNR6_9MICO|nr:Gfo/Idh/MocA family oxidoreductase [Knoellia subterranea]KGN38798.1 oxidoreductase [Knoellia subterranea KCTC 19937]
MTTTPTSLPAPRTPDPHSAPTLRWGVLGPGYIARAMSTALAAETDQVIQAVASRDLSRAQGFADDFGAHTAYGSYDELVNDPNVDIVYVATPHSEHHEHARLALDAGKPVLVEKAFARNAAEARDILDTARDRGLLAMEAMWTRFLPGVDVVRQCLEQGLLGEVENVFADHGQPLFPNGPQRLSDPALAGGALLDLGIYPISFANFALGGITSVAATGRLTDEGVDAEETVLVTGAGGRGVLHATMTSRTPTTASINGTAGRLELGDPDDPNNRWYAPSRVRFVSRDTTTDISWEPEDRMHGLHFEACEAARLVDAGLTESPLLPAAETLRIMEVLDEVRSQIGVRYPGE